MNKKHHKQKLQKQKTEELNLDVDFFDADFGTYSEDFFYHYDFNQDEPYNSLKQVEGKSE